jgi:hypothetical protein
MRVKYDDKRISPARLEVIREANAILAEYQRQGFTLTLRQLYYQFVSRGLIPNRDSEYKKLGDTIADARMTGQLDWELIIDRTRRLTDLPHWDDPAGVIRSALASFNNDKWAEQPYRCEVWIEKDALVGVIEPTCRALDVPYFSCRGYTSLSAAWEAGQRIGEHLDNGQKVKVIHLGDHDPSGIDMTRDIGDRLRRFLVQDHYNASAADDGGAASFEFVDDHFEVIRIALTMEQIDQYDPPPNPAKLTDSRGAGYVEEYGYDSWELDALEPSVIAALIEDEVTTWRDDTLWEDAVAEEERQKGLLRQASARWAEVETFLTEGD